MARRKARYTNKVTGGLTRDMYLTLSRLKSVTGHSYSSLVREAIGLLADHYKKNGY